MDPRDMDELERIAYAAGVDRLRNATEDLVATLEGSDPEDPIDSVIHLVDEVREALSLMNVLDGPEEGEQAVDSPPECELCAGQGFGSDEQGAVACPQCHGTGVQPEDVRPIAEEGFDDEGEEE